MAEEIIPHLVRSLAYMSCVGLSLSGVCLGIVNATPGITLASEIKFEISSFLASLVFISAPSLYAFIIFFLFNMTKDDQLDIVSAFKLLTNGVILGVSSGISAYGLGIANRSLLPTKAKRPKFSVQFYLVNIFIELVSLIGLIITFIGISSIKADTYK